MRTAVLRAANASSRQLLARRTVPALCSQQTRQAHAISNPTLADIEKRWEGLPPQEQADLWMALRDRMKVDWNELTLQEKKAGMCNQDQLRGLIRIQTIYLSHHRGMEL
jgi:cytochrome c oxidase subunit 4